jgi:hypothetical protein
MASICNTESSAQQMIKKGALIFVAMQCLLVIKHYLPLLFSPLTMRLLNVIFRLLWCYKKGQVTKHYLPGGKGTAVDT